MVSAVRSSVTVTAASTYTDKTGQLAVGGLAGATGGGSIENCYSTGAVTASSSAMTGNFLVGGIVGFNLIGIVNYCYATGDVSASETSSGAPNLLAGGIVGYLSGALTRCVALQSTMNVTTDTADNAIFLSRVYGYIEGGSPSNNYARSSGMTLSITGGGIDSSDPSIGADKPHGENFTNSGKNAWSTPGWIIGDSVGSESAPWVWDSGIGMPTLWFE
jgi:hypothetical protein